MHNSSLKTSHCLLVVGVFSTFFFCKSVEIRKPWIVPTFLQVSNWLEHKQHITAGYLAYTNNWIQEGPLNLRLGRYMYPASVETSTLAKRKFHPSYPPGATTALFLLFKTLDATGLVPNIQEKRGSQLLVVIALNYAFHFLLVLVMGGLVFAVCRKIGFDNLNCTILAFIPAIVLFHNAGTLYWFHLVYAAPVIIVPLFVLYILLEVLQSMQLSPRLLRSVQIAQPVLMFIGIFTSWLFVFVIATVYVMRFIRDDITQPRSLPQAWRWLQQSFFFVLPAALALGIWIYSMVYYQQHVVSESFFELPVSSGGLTFGHNILFKMGILDEQGQLLSFDQVFDNYRLALFAFASYEYGLSGVLSIYLALYLAIRNRKIAPPNTAATTYLLLFLPCLLFSICLVVDDSHHHFAAVKYSPALAMSFILVPIFILQILKKCARLTALRTPAGREISLVAVLGLGSAIIWAYLQIYQTPSVTKLFSPPAYHHIQIGEFIRKHTGYNDVVFSKDYYQAQLPFVLRTHFTHKLMHFAANLDHVYSFTRDIGLDFTVNIFYYPQRQPEIQQLQDFIESHSLTTNSVSKPQVGGLLSFDGKQFRSWYEQTRAAN